MGRGASPLPIPHPLEKFLFKKSDNVCEFKGGCPVNGMASEKSNAKNWGPLIYFTVLF